MTRRSWLIAAAVAVVTSLLGAALVVTLRRGPERIGATLSVAGVLGTASDDGVFERATMPRAFRFPDDHGPHPEFRDEWWYWTGNLDGPGGRHFGYELTIFRSALAPGAPSRKESAWRAHQMYMAHFALTDVEGNHFYAFEQTSRGALGLAGANLDPFRVWVEDWSAESASPELSPIHLRAARADVAIDLTLTPAKPVTPQGDRGLSQKGPAPGNASFYYSITRLPTSGVVTLPSGRVDVSGQSWMDREWSTSALDSADVGWDWFALQLDDNRELMFFRLRRRDGGTDPWSAGTLVGGPTGRPGLGGVRRLSASQVQLEALDKWKSPHTGVVYPSTFRLRVPSEGIDCLIQPFVEDQEVNLAFRYWEGAVRVTDPSGPGGNPGARKGQGYVELTGYGEPLAP
jgi:predicted secreted hydrolase